MSENSAVWESVGRGSPAGRALYNLFSEDINGRQTGDKFSARNKAVFEAKIAMGWKPSSPGELATVQLIGALSLLTLLSGACNATTCR